MNVKLMLTQNLSHKSYFKVIKEKKNYWKKLIDEFLLSSGSIIYFPVHQRALSLDVL